MNTVPEKPNAKLSALIVNTKADKLGPALFKNKKNKFVTVNKMLLIINNFPIPKRATVKPPMNAPIMVMVKPKTFVTVKRNGIKSNQIKSKQTIKQSNKKGARQEVW